MKHYFWLLAFTPLMLVTISGIAQGHSTRDFYSGPDVMITDPAIITRSAEASSRALEAWKLKEQAKEAITNGDFPAGFSLLQQANSDNPTDGENCMLLAYFYIQKGQADAVIATLKPIVYPSSGASNSTGDDTTTRMIYVLALLDRNAWREAVQCYQTNWRPLRMERVPGVSKSPVQAGGTSHIWNLPGGGPSHSWPDPKFSPDTPDYPGLRAQAHLILGSSVPSFMKEKDQFPYMLEHLRQVLQINPNSLDAHFISGCLLGKTDRFDEARSAYASAAQLGTASIQKEINVELSKLKASEDAKKPDAALKAAKQVKLK